MKIALNTYSIRKEFPAMTKKSWDPVFQLIDWLGVKEIELFDRHFTPPTLKSVQEKFTARGINIFSLGPHPHLLTNESEWPAAIADGKKWVDICADHGIPYFRVAIGGGKYNPPTATPKSLDEAVDWAVKVFEPVIQHAESRGVTPCIETHHRYSSNPEWQEKLIDRIGSKNLGFAFDIGNFENDQLRWASLDVLIKKKAVKYMHAKAYRFDAQGNETTLDYPRAVKQLHDAGFDIPLSIEWEGNLAGPIGALRSNELCKYSIARALGQTYTMKTDFSNEEAWTKQFSTGLLAKLKKLFGL
jgi:sugar phosphate isomerase/epimerase